MAIVAAAALALLGLLLGPMLIFGAGGMLEESGGSCQGATGGTAAQPPASQAAQNSIPANYLTLFKQVGRQYGVPWVILAGIGKVESDDGRTTLPGVHSGANAYGAAGPMQIGIGGAAGNAWGGAPIHPASEHVDGVATDETGDGIADVYNPADAIAGTAKYLLRNGVLSNPAGAVFAYNHLESYVQEVLYWAGTYARGGYTVSAATSTDDAGTASQMTGCLPGGELPPNEAVATAISYAEAQLGKPYQYGGTGPNSFDCSGLVMMAYRAAGIDIPRTSEQQWAFGPRVKPSQVEPGDLVFFVGADGTRTEPGHVGLVIGGGLMIEAYATGYPIMIAPYRSGDPVGFTRPWTHKGVTLAGSDQG